MTAHDEHKTPEVLKPQVASSSYITKPTLGFASPVSAVWAFWSLKRKEIYSSSLEY